MRWWLRIFRPWIVGATTAAQVLWRWWWWGLWWGRSIYRWVWWSWCNCWRGRGFGHHSANMIWRWGSIILPMLLWTTVRATWKFQETLEISELYLYWVFTFFSPMLIKIKFILSFCYFHEYHNSSNVTNKQ